MLNSESTSQTTIITKAANQMASGSTLGHAAATSTPWGRKTRNITALDVFGSPASPSNAVQDNVVANGAMDGDDDNDALLEAAMSAYEERGAATNTGPADQRGAPQKGQQSYSTPLRPLYNDNRRLVTEAAANASEFTSPGGSATFQPPQSPVDLPFKKANGSSAEQAGMRALLHPVEHGAASNAGDDVPDDDLELPQFDHYSGKEWIYPSNYPERAYQRNIAWKCLLRNTLVALPTGLGKTFIAAVVMYNYYRWFPSGMVVFMAPTKPLVTQQIRACFDIMGFDRNDICDLTGSIAPAKRYPLYRTKRVVFASPQVIQNDLVGGHCPVERIVCMVIDEAHRAVGEHAYCTVAKYAPIRRISPSQSFLHPSCFCEVVGQLST